jgi:hypothetical protein
MRAIEIVNPQRAGETKVYSLNAAATALIPQNPIRGVSKSMDFQSVSKTASQDEPSETPKIQLNGRSFLRRAM